MTTGYKEFEFDLPGALLAKLVRVFENLEPAVLTPEAASNIPEEQGVYQLLGDCSSAAKPLYVGKTDAEAGLQKRLIRHASKIQDRVGLDPNTILFKAVRVFVFTAVDLETQLIKHYGGTAWNGSGFGSNDPGKERDTTKYKPEHFDTIFPIDIDRPLTFSVPISTRAADVLKVLKRNLPYLIRFQRIGNSKRAHPDLEDTHVEISTPFTTKSILQQVVAQLPTGWHATLLPSHVIIYKDDIRSFPSGQLLAHSPAA